MRFGKCQVVSGLTLDQGSWIKPFNELYNERRVPVGLQRGQSAAADPISLYQAARDVPTLNAITPTWGLGVREQSDSSTFTCYWQTEASL